MIFLKKTDTIRTENEEEKMKKYTEDFIRKTTNRKILSAVLKRGKNDGVSRCAAENPHCPPEAKKMHSLMTYIKQRCYNLLNQIKIDFPEKTRYSTHRK